MVSERSCDTENIGVMALAISNQIKAALVRLLSKKKNVLNDPNHLNTCLQTFGSLFPPQNEK